MPVRKIPKNYRSITGYFPSLKNNRSIAFESALERDFFLTLEFDENVVEYEEQPVKLSENNNGKKLEYTPDCLVRYQNGVKALVEVKYSKDLQEHAVEYEPKFSLAKRYSVENGLQFKIITEIEIRNQPLDNFRLLYRFARPSRNFSAGQNLILATLKEDSTMALGELLKKLGDEKSVQASFTPAIWHLLFQNLILADLTEPISYDTILRINNEKNIP